MEKEKPKRKSKKTVKQKKIKTFSAQVNCVCKKSCAQLIDVVAQQEIFDQFYGQETWSNKTQYLRSIVKRAEAKENLNPRFSLKNKNYFSSYFLCDSNNKQQRVCSLFLTKLLQINRMKIFRAVQSTQSNPYAIDRRGKAPNKKKTATEDITFAKTFIQTFPLYESKFKPRSLDIKYFHPRLTLSTIYQLYENTCNFKEKKVLSKSVFKKIMNENFNHLQMFKFAKHCSHCQSTIGQKKKKVLSPESIEKIQKNQDDHMVKVKDIKNQFLRCIQEPEIGVAVLTIELQRPLEMPLLSVDESYDIRNLWFSNLCVFDELDQKAYMYVWEEFVAKRGPEEIASCLFEHIAAIQTTTKKLIIHSNATSLYRNTKMIMFLVQIMKERRELQTIEQRFFFPGHDTNDCSCCIDKIEKKIRATERVFTPNDYITIMSSTKKTDPIYTVVQMASHDFYAIELLPNSTTNQIDWTDVKSVVYNRNEPMLLRLNYFSCDSEEILTFDEKSWNEFHKTELVISNMNGIAISKQKYDDLVLKTLKYIPSEYHAYYTSIKFDEAQNADYVLASNDE